MAERRMIAKSVIETNEFYSLSPTAQALYLHFTMVADNNGTVANFHSVVKQFKIWRKALAELQDNGYVVISISQVLSIPHWTVANRLRNNTDRNAMSKRKHNDSTVTESRVCDDTGVTGYRETSDRCATNEHKKFNLPIEAEKEDFCVQHESRIESSRVEKSLTEINRGESEGNNYTLSPEQQERLIGDYGKQNVEKYVRLVTAYYRNKASPPKDFAATVEMWMIRDGVTKPSDSESDFAGEPLDLDDYRQFINNFD